MPSSANLRMLRRTFELEEIEQSVKVRNDTDLGRKLQDANHCVQRSWSHVGGAGWLVGADVSSPSSRGVEIGSSTSLILGEEVEVLFTRRAQEMPRLGVIT